MKQPKLFKEYRERWENPIYLDEVTDAQLEQLKDKVTQAEERYEAAKNIKKEREGEEKEMLNYFKYLDTLGKKR